MRSYWVLNPMIGVFIGERGGFRYKDTKGRMLCNDGGRDWSNAKQSQRTSRVASSQQGMRKKVSFLSLPWDPAP